jgi:hypothetical protein
LACAKLIVSSARQRYRFSAGDLVSWKIDDANVMAVVVEVYPANIYEKEACHILAEGRVYTVPALYLSSLKKEPD